MGKMDIEHPPLITETPMSDENGYQTARTEDYTNLLPNPPRILIPPIHYHRTSTPPIATSKVIPNSDPRLNVEFLNGVKTAATLRTSPSAWNYATRREAQEVVSFLHLGPLYAAKDKEYLQRAGITMMLGVQPKGVYGAKLTAAAFKVAEELGIERAFVEANGHKDLIKILPRATELINIHLAAMHQRVQFAATPSREGKVLVFCESGNDKSASIVAAYLFETFEDVDAVKAIQMACYGRFCCSFTDELKRVLSTYYDIVVAKRAIQEDSLLHPASASAAGGAAYGRLSSGGKSSKRRHSRDADDDEMDVDGDEADDVERFRGRSVTPFV